jgi:hypothetical protein
MLEKMLLATGIVLLIVGSTLLVLDRKEAERNVRANFNFTKTYIGFGSLVVGTFFIALRLVMSL